MNFLDKLSQALPSGLKIRMIYDFCPAEQWRTSPEKAAYEALEKSGWFDGQDYLLRYPDVASSGMDPLVHFIHHGIGEGRSFRPPLLQKNISQPGAEAAADAAEVSQGAIIGISPLLDFGTTWGKGHEELIRLTPRPHVSDFIVALDNYDVISFDIFDTALLRKVEFPKNIFDILALEMNWLDFTAARMKSEQVAREEMEQNAGHREIVLDDIYAVLRKRFGIDPAWAEREIELEKAAAVVNPYIFSVYQALQYRGKTLIFTSDMYLPEKAIMQMLADAGYENYHRLYLSNVCKLRKGDGTLQARLLADFPGRKIVHVGDNLHGDVETSAASGIDSVWYQECRLTTREPYLNNISGSFYRAVINNSLNNGLWNKNRFYTHGFRVGGILAAGYCQHLNKTAKENNCEKILFCGRDCFIIQKVYDSFYHKYDNSYIETSRLATMMLTPERYLNDILHRFIFRHWDEQGNLLTLRQLLDETGFGYLADSLEEYDLNPFAFCMSSKKELFSEFFLNQLPKIIKATAPAREAAKKYFGDIIGNAKRLLIADVGWSGTCIDALETFFKNGISSEISVVGALICSSNTQQVANAIMIGHFHPYVSSPVWNSDLSNFMTPTGKKSSRDIDRLHMPLEYLFTATTPSLKAYGLNDEGDAQFLRDNNTPVNEAEILDMQAGIYDFNALYSAYAGIMACELFIPPYTAFVPLKNAIGKDLYCYEIYGGFLYDAGTAAGQERIYSRTFADFFDHSFREKSEKKENNSRKILFVTPELTYTGTPQSLLRTARVAKELGFEPVVWSAKDGPFRQEFEREDIEVKIVQPDLLKNMNSADLPTNTILAYCNTIMTDAYVRFLNSHVPTIWFIREATNIPSFCDNNPERLELLQNYDSIYCVSEYARDAIAQHTSQKIHVLRNCVEDESALAVNYAPGSGEKVKFVQFGTMEYRKGYDVLVAAYKSLPAEYKNSCELYFAGGFINSGAPYCEYLFQEMRDEPGIHYLGIIKGAKNKIETLSQMDVVVVASRDESCSLVALEGAMLSKPLIVTENVGAKYMVSGENGLIVATGDVDAMREAMMRMIDNRPELAEMGKWSRLVYENEAGMEIYKKDIEALIAREVYAGKPKVIVSLTSYPARMETIAPCLKSLLAQTYGNRLIILWLSSQQFPGLEDDLPDAVRDLLQKNIFEIRWVEDDLKPHKKYFYAMREFADMPVVTVDDDAIYEPEMLANLVDSYLRHPHAVSCHRANLMQMRKDGSFKPYKTWIMDYSLLKDRPSYWLMPTGVGGVLYPPHALPEMAFDAEAIKSTCLMADDLWLKMMTAQNGYPSVVAKNKNDHVLIAGSQETALWRDNVIKGENNILLKDIADFIEEKLESGNSVLDTIWNGLYIN